jgi:hypothetical protein
VNVYLNKNDLCREVHYCANSTLGKIENWSAIVGSYAKFLDLVALPSKQLGDNLVQ